MNTRNGRTADAIMLASLVSLAILIGLAGCQEDFFDAEKSLPAPLPTELPYEFEGTIFRIWGGDYFDILKSKQLHYVCLQGIDCPKPGQPFYREACDELRRLANGQNLKMVVVALDDSKVAYVQAFLPGPTDSQFDNIDIGLELIKRGYGWYDGNSFEGSDLYQSAEAESRKAKRGLWSDPDPIPPWRFETDESPTRE